jgi:hypothetical protein
MLDTKYGMKYPFPHTLVHIVDNSSYTGDLPVVVAQDPSMYGTLVVSGLPMGEDNKVIQVMRSDILNVAYGLGNIGTSEIKKYGQTITYPLSIIDQGAPVQLLRITPSDATYAYSCITIEWRWDKENKKLHVRYGNYSLENDMDLVNFQNKQRLAEYIKKHAKNDAYVDDTGETWVRRAFIVNVSAGRGSAYNNFTTTINQTVQAKRPANVRYLFTTINTMTNLAVEQFHASLVNVNNHREDAIDPVNIVVGKRAAGSSVVVPFLNEEAVQELYNVYRGYFAEMLNDNSNLTTDYETDVFKTLTVNTFDPIFGLYLYGGTDSNALLPFFQVDMRTADRPELPESQRVYYNGTLDAEGKPVDANEDLINVDAKVSESLINITTGIKKVGTDASGVIDSKATYLGDVYLYAGITSDTNPFVYIVTGINQYTKSVTTVRTNMMHFYRNDLGTDVDSKLAFVCATKDRMTFVKEVRDKIAKGFVKDGDTVAWAVPSGDTVVWDLYFVKEGSADKVKAGTYVSDLESEANFKLWLMLYFDETIANNKNNRYDFIAWDTMDNVGNVVGLASERYEGGSKGEAFKRAGSTCFNLDADISSTSTAEPVWVNSGYKDADDHEITYAVANRNLTTIRKYGAPPTTTTLIASDVVGTQYDAFCVSEDKAEAYRIQTDSSAQGYVAITISNVPTGTIVPPERTLGWTPESTRFRFAPIQQSAGGDITLSEITKSEISKTYYATEIENSGLAAFVALNVYDGYLHEGEFYRTKDTWTEDDKYDKTTDESKWSVFRDFTDPSSIKYYKCDGSAYTLLEGITGMNQILRWYKQNTNGEWMIDTSVPTDAPDPQVADGWVLGGLSLNFVAGNFTWVQDARAAVLINRYTVTGTIGSLYRIQMNKVTIPANYYSSSYGINVTSSSSDVKLHDGYTGFFDEYGTAEMSDIEYKWEYSRLLVKAFRGQIDPRIMSPTRVPAKYLFDGGWNTVVGQSALPSMSYSAADLIAASTIFTADEKDEVLFNPELTAGWSAQNSEIDVKQAMYDLMDYRVYSGIPEDKRPVGPGSGMSLHLDSGVTDAEMALTINNSFIKRFDNPNASWDIGGWYASVDGLPYTYVKRLADNLFRHCQTYTVNKPFVNTYSKIDRSEYVSYFPDIDTTDWDYRELMYNSGGNAWIPDVNGAIMRRSQRTLMRGSDTSDLIQESNMRTLTQLVYILQNKLDEKLFEYNDDSFLRTMQDEVTNMFTNWVGSLVDGLDIHFERDINPLDGGELIVCYVDVVFRGINLRIPVIVNVNRRVTTT